MSLPRVSSSGLARGSSDLHTPELADRWMAGTSPAMTMRGDKGKADRIRDELSAMGIQLKDAKNATTGEIETTWEVKR